MHELSVINNLLKVLEKIQEEQKAEEFLAVNLTINPYSCLDEENLNFIFHSLTKNKPLYKNTRIHIKRNNNPASREFILDSVEVSSP
jgi:Zn finger protein HypA/HybF involved in hydrogenase expression